jgi:hypothetical protein
MFGKIGSMVGSLTGLTGGYKPTAYNVNKKAFDLPEYAQGQKQMSDMLSGYQTRQSAFGPTDIFREGQLAQIQALQQQAAGQGPSLAQLQLQQATNRNLAQQMAATAAGSAPNAGLALRQGLLGGAMASQGAAGQSAQLRLQEQMDAQSQLANALQSGRGQDISFMSANDQAVQNILNQYLQQQQQERAAKIQREQTMAGIVGQQNALGQANYGQQLGLFGNMLGSVGSLAQSGLGKIGSLWGSGGTESSSTTNPGQK